MHTGVRQQRNDNKLLENIFSWAQLGAEHKSKSIKILDLESKRRFLSAALLLPFPPRREHENLMRDK